MSEIVEQNVNGEYSLYCETSLYSGDDTISIKWLKDNDIDLSEMDQYEIRESTPDDRDPNARFRSTIVFKDTSMQLINGVYKCSLIVNTDDYEITKNSTFEAHKRCKNY